MSNELRLSPSGIIGQLKGTMAMASFVIATTAGATQTATLSGARENDVVDVSPRANLTGSAVGIAFKRVVTADTIVIGFTNPGASTNQAAVTFDVELSRRPNVS